MRVSARGLAVAGWLLSAAGAATAATPNTAKSSDTFAKSAKKAPVIIAPPPAEIVAEALRAEMDAYARRLDACTRLRQIAIETGNDALLQSTDEIERQAAAIYQARVARLGVNSKLPPESRLEARLGASVDPLKVAPPQPLTGRASR